jgi:hypothetical protein
LGTISWQVQDFMPNLSGLILGTVEADTLITLLSIGLFTLALDALDRGPEREYISKQSAVNSEQFGRHPLFTVH